MTEFLTMCEAYEALLTGLLVAGEVFAVTSQPGKVFLVRAGSKLELAREEVLAP